MIFRATIAGTCSLLLACGPGPGTSDGGTASTDETTMTKGTSGDATGSSSSTHETTPTTGGNTGTTGGTSTTGTSTSEGTSTGTETTSATSAGTTGAPACEDIVGSRDCAELVAVSGDLNFETCMTCQGAACGQVRECDAQFPCIDQQIVIQGCCSDDQCAGLTPFCGMFIAVNNVCVNSDDV